MGDGFFDGMGRSGERGGGGDCGKEVCNKFQFFENRIESEWLSTLEAFINAPPSGRGQSYVATATFNGSPIRVDRNSPVKFKSITPKLEIGGQNEWVFSLYVQNDRLISALEELIMREREALQIIERELELETDPEKISELLSKKSKAENAISDGLKQITLNRRKIGEDARLGLPVGE